MQIFYSRCDLRTEYFTKMMKIKTTFKGATESDGKIYKMSSVTISLLMSGFQQELKDF